MLSAFDPRWDSPVPVYDRASLIDALRRVLPSDGLLTEHEAMRVYECDGLAAYRALPGLVALPRTTEQVRGVLAACAGMRVPVVARGAGTGPSGWRTAISSVGASRPVALRQDLEH